MITSIFYLNPVHKMAALKPDYKISISSHFVLWIMKRNRRLYFHCSSSFKGSIKIWFYNHLMGPYIYTFWATHLKSHFGRMGKVIKILWAKSLCILCLNFQSLSIQDSAGCIHNFDSPCLQNQINFLQRFWESILGAGTSTHLMIFEQVVADRRRHHTCGSR